MTEYLVTFQRSNGSFGADSFTATNEGDARNSFRECYRHGTYNILSTMPVTGDTCSSCGSTSIWPADAFCRNCGAELANGPQADLEKIHTKDLVKELASRDNVMSLSAEPFGRYALIGCYDQRGKRIYSECVLIVNPKDVP